MTKIFGFFFFLILSITSAQAQYLGGEQPRETKKINFDGFHIGVDSGIFYNSKTREIGQFLGAGLMWRERSGDMTFGFEFRYNHLFNEIEKSRLQGDVQIGYVIGDNMLISGLAGLVHRPDYLTSLKAAKYYVDFKIGLAGEIYIDDHIIAKLGYHMVFDKLGNGKNHYLNIGVLFHY
jgi:hypothetical protein